MTNENKNGEKKYDTSQIDETLRELGVTRKFLAERMSVSPAAFNRKVNTGWMYPSQWDRCWQIIADIRRVGSLDKRIPEHHLAEIKRMVRLAKAMANQIDDPVVQPRLENLHNEIIERLIDL